MAQECLSQRPSSPGLRAVTVVYEHRIPDQERRYAAAVAEAMGADEAAGEAALIRAALKLLAPKS